MKRWPGRWLALSEPVGRLHLIIRRDGACQINARFFEHNAFGWFSSRNRSNYSLARFPRLGIVVGLNKA